MGLAGVALQLRPTLPAALLLAHRLQVWRLRFALALHLVMKWHLTSPGEGTQPCLQGAEELLRGLSGKEPGSSALLLLDQSLD